MSSPDEPPLVRTPSGSWTASHRFRSTRQHGGTGKKTPVQPGRVSLGLRLKMEVCARFSIILGGNNNRDWTVSCSVGVSE